MWLRVWFACTILCYTTVFISLCIYWLNDAKFWELFQWCDSAYTVIHIKQLRNVLVKVRWKFLQWIRTVFLTYLIVKVFWTSVNFWLSYDEKIACFFLWLTVWFAKWQAVVKVVFKRWQSCVVHGQHLAWAYSGDLRAELPLGSRGFTPPEEWHFNIWR